MPNQALAFHCVSERVYDLSGLRTGSIRDQLLRSTLVVQCLVDEGIVDRFRPLLVFGAGAAGVNAALVAAKRGVSVDVLEREPHPFATLALADWRRVDPVEYDWPHPHCRDACFPAHARGIPLVQTSGTAADLAHAWAAELQTWDSSFNGRGRLGTTRFLTGCDANDFLQCQVDATKRVIEVTGPWAGKSAPKSMRQYGAILSCIGFSGERTSSTDVPDPWSDYVGPAFWTENDGLGRTNPLPMDYRHVLITGGGDGAMQDFQRATTGWFGLDLLDRIGAGLPGWVKPAHFVEGSTLASFLMAEDAGRRVHAWKRDRQPLTKSLQDWHQAFAVGVDTLVAGWSDAQVHSLCSAILEPAVWRGDRQVTWIHREETPGYAYALNRFLCLLIEKLLARLSTAGFKLPVQVHAMSEIESLRPSSTSHRCGLARGCRGQDHDVSIFSHRLGTRWQLTSDLVIVRHGALYDRVLVKRAPVPEQLTPYGFPV